MMTLRPFLKTMTGLAAIGLAGLALTANPASAATERFENKTDISIPDFGKGSPYPAKIPVSGLPGQVTDVTVALNGFKHDFPRGVEVLLVSPSKRAVLLASDVCGSSAVNSGRWTFNQDFGAEIPKDGSCGSGIYKPTNHPGQSVDNTWRDFLPAPAPPGPYPSNLDEFIGDNPNGEWSLYVHDERTFKGGRIPGGWSITISSEPADVLIPGGAAGESSKYPQTKRIDGVDGLITDVDVAVDDIYHERAADLDLVLVGPRGQNVLLMSDACGTGRVKRLSVDFDDEAANVMPASNCERGSYKPTNYGFGDSLPAPAPAGPYGTALSTFDNTDPNGEWKLYVADDEADKRGFITQPWKLDIKTRPRSPVSFAAKAQEIAEGENAQVRIVRGGLDTPIAGTVTVKSSPVSATSGTDFEPVSSIVTFAPGERERTVPIRALTDGQVEEDEKLLLTIGDATGDAVVATPAANEITIKDRTPAPQPQGQGNQDGGQGEDPVDRVAPTIGRVALKPTRFAVARGRTARKRGTTIRYSLSEAAGVTVRIERARGKRFVPAGTVRGSGRAGANAVRFTGLVGRRALKPGTYRLRVVARDAAGNESTSAAKRFRVVKR
jgi:subtilisin-like proprotein convertase family protein